MWSGHDQACSHVSQIAQSKQSRSKKKKKRKRERKKRKETKQKKKKRPAQFVKKDDPPENATCHCWSANAMVHPCCASGVSDGDVHDKQATATDHALPSAKVWTLLGWASFKICVFCRSTLLLSISRSPSIFLFLSVFLADMCVFQVMSINKSMSSNKKLLSLVKLVKLSVSCFQKCYPSKRPPPAKHLHSPLATPLMMHRRCQTKEPLIQHDFPARPWSKVGAGIANMGDQNLLIAVDYYSNCIEVARLISITSRSMIRELRIIFLRFGIPDTLVTDNGPQLPSAEFVAFAKSWGFQHITSSPMCPQSNGKAENAVKTVKQLFWKWRQAGQPE